MVHYSGGEVRDVRRGVGEKGEGEGMDAVLYRVTRVQEGIVWLLKPFQAKDLLMSQSVCWQAALLTMLHLWTAC